jgi:hypothetical protein
MFYSFTTKCPEIDPIVFQQNYVTLIKEFREVWDRHGLLLTAAVAAAPNSVDLSYDVPALSKYDCTTFSDS